MQALINWIDIFTSDAPLFFQIMLFGMLIALGCLIIEIIVVSIIWFIEDIRLKPEREKTRKEIDKTIAELKKAKQDRKEAPIIEMYLYEDLKKYCRDNLIPLRYGENFFKDRTANASGFISYLIDKKRKDAFGYQIYLRTHDEEDDKGTNVWTLAHELGHYRSIEDYKDSSELGADYEARKLCESFLTQNDLDNEYFEIALHCHTMKLEEMEKFKHIENLMEDI